MEETQLRAVPQEVPAKRRGRPRKVQAESKIDVVESGLNETKKRGRGRPRKVEAIDNNLIEDNKEDNNKISNTNTATPLNLFELGDEDVKATKQLDNTTTYSDMILPGLDDDELMYQETMSQNDEIGLESVIAPSEPSLPDVTNTFDSAVETNQDVLKTTKQNVNTTPNYEPQATKTIQNTEKYNMGDTNLGGLLSRDKKVVAFVGTSKNGTSFLVNNLAEMLSEKGIKTAILDLTQNKNTKL